MNGPEENFVTDITKIIFRKCTDSWHIPEQETNAFNLTYIIKGAAKYILDGKPYELGEGDLICLSKGAIRKANTFPDRLMQCFSVDFNLKSVRGEADSLPFSTICQVGIKNDVEHMFFDLCNTWLSKLPGYQIKCRGLFLLILHRFMEIVTYKIDSESGDFRIRRVKRFVLANFPKKITVKKMADMIGLNTAYFGTLFKKETGISFNHYLIQTRIRNAENMLMSGEYSVGDAAEACGFSDVIHFYKHFKAILGFSPSRCIPKMSPPSGGSLKAAASAERFRSPR